MSIHNKCEECKRKMGDQTQWASVQMYGGEWKVVCISCAKKLKAAGMLGKAMDDINFD
jgi:hypothetical protein